jgi:hypothetical protein
MRSSAAVQSIGELKTAPVATQASAALYRAGLSLVISFNENHSSKQWIIATRSSCLTRNRGRLVNAVGDQAGNGLVDIPGQHQYVLLSRTKTVAVNHRLSDCLIAVLRQRSSCCRFLVKDYLPAAVG